MSEVELNKDVIVKYLDAYRDAFDRINSEDELVLGIVQIFGDKNTFDVVMGFVKEEYRRNIYDIYMSVLRALRRISEMKGR